MEKRAKWVLSLTALLLTAMLGWAWTHRAPEPITVHTAKAAVTDVHCSVTVSGTVEAAEGTLLCPAHTAVVKQVFAALGDTVQQGDLLCTLSVADDVEWSKAADAVRTAFIANGKAQTSESETALYAPQDGTVVQIPSCGDIVLAGMSCVQVADMRRLQVRANIPELYAEAVKRGQRANISAPAAGETVYSASVKRVAPAAVRAFSLTGQNNAATVETVLSIAGQTKGLRPGYTVSAKIFTEQHSGVAVVPIAAVCQRGEQEFVFCMEAGRVKQRAVETGYMLENAVEIVQGLNGDETLVLSPSDRLADGMYVEVIS